MTKSLVITCFAHVPLEDFNAFLVGENKQHIDTATLAHHFSKHILHKINALPKLIASSKLPFTLAIPGFVIEILHKHYPQTCQTLTHFIAHNPVELAIVPFYNTSLYVMDDVELQQQVQWHIQSCKKQFAKQPKVFFSQEKISLSQKRLLQKMGCGVLTQKQSSLTQVISLEELPKQISNLFSGNLPEYILLSELALQKSGEIDNLIKKKSVSLHPLQEHVVRELSGLKPYIMQQSSTHNDMLKSWRLLLQPSRLQQIHPQTATVDHSPYELYAQMMHMCGDVATTILSTAAAKKGEIYNTPVVSDSPSQVVQEFFKKGVTDEQFTSFVDRKL